MPRLSLGWWDHQIYSSVNMPLIFTPFLYSIIPISDTISNKDAMWMTWVRIFHGNDLSSEVSRKWNYHMILVQIHLKNYHTYVHLYIVICREDVTSIIIISMFIIEV